MSDSLKPTSEELSAFLDGELEPAARARVEAWLAAHPGAQRELDQLRAAEKALGGASEEEAHFDEQAFQHSLWKEVDRRRPRPVSFFQGPQMWIPALAAAALVVVLVGRGKNPFESHAPAGRFAAGSGIEDTTRAFTTSKDIKPGVSPDANLGTNPGAQAAPPAPREAEAKSSTQAPRDTPQGGASAGVASAPPAGAASSESAEFQAGQLQAQNKAKEQPSPARAPMSFSAGSNVASRPDAAADRLEQSSAKASAPSAAGASPALPVFLNGETLGGFVARVQRDLTVTDSRSALLKKESSRHTAADTVMLISRLMPKLLHEGLTEDASGALRWLQQLSPGSGEACQGILDLEAARFQMEHGPGSGELLSPDRAQQAINSVDTWRSIVRNCPDNARGWALLGWALSERFLAKASPADCEAAHHAFMQARNLHPDSEASQIVAARLGALHSCDSTSAGH